MTVDNDAGYLLTLVRAALTRADEQDDTLVAALLSECVDVIEQRSGR